VNSLNLNVKSCAFIYTVAVNAVAVYNSNIFTIFLFIIFYCPAFAFVSVTIIFLESKMFFFK